MTKQTVYIETDNESLIVAALSELIEFKIRVDRDMLQAFGSRTRLAAMAITFSSNDRSDAYVHLAQWLYEKLQEQGLQTITVNGVEIEPQQQASQESIWQALEHEE